MTTNSEPIPKDDAKKKNRSFKVKLSEESELYGRYNGDSPYQAANKALSEIIRNRVKENKLDDAEINFFLQESTKGSNKKTHQYIGKRIQLETPVEYKVGDQVIVKNFKNVLKKVKQTGVVKKKEKVVKASKAESKEESTTKKTTVKVAKPKETKAKEETVEVAPVKVAVAKTAPVKAAAKTAPVKAAPVKDTTAKPKGTKGVAKTTVAK